MNNKGMEDIAIAKLDLANLDTSYLIELAIAKKKKSDFAKAELDAITAQIQNRAIEYQEARHIKFTELKGEGSGFASVTVAGSLDILNYKMLEEYLGKDLLAEKIKIKPADVKYDIDANFKKAIIALMLSDFEKNTTLPELLDKTGWCSDEPARKSTLLKKLKGDYKKDKKTVFDMLNISKEDDFDIDTELYLIYQIKNWDLIKAYFDTDKLEETKEVLDRFILANETAKISLKEV